MAPQGSSGIHLMIRGRADMTVRPRLAARSHGLPLPGHPPMSHPCGPRPGGGSVGPTVHHRGLKMTWKLVVSWSIATKAASFTWAALL